MALISCPDCNKDVSDRAEKCLNCGAPISPITPTRIIKKEPEEELVQDTSLNAKFSATFETDKKSPASALIIAFIFGPLGTFYVSTGAAFVMILVYLLSLFGGQIGVFLVSVVNMFICYSFAGESNEKLKSDLLIKQNREKVIIRELENDKLQENFPIDNSEYSGL